MNFTVSSWRKKGFESQLFKFLTYTQCVCDIACAIAIQQKFNRIRFKMQNINGQTDEITQLQLDDKNTLKTIRMELREVAFTKRKEDRVSVWNRNRANLGVSSENGPFQFDHIDEKAILLKKKRISCRDYRYLPNALIQVRSTVAIDQSD